MATAPFALTRPARLLSKPVLFRVAPASVTNLPPWLFNSPRLVTSRLPALEKVPAWLLTWSAFTVSDPSLTSAPLPWLSNAPLSVTSTRRWLLSRPPSPLSSSAPSRCNPSRLASTPLAWFSRRCTVRLSSLSPITLPPVVQLFPDSQSHLGHAGYFPTAVIDLACLGGDPPSALTRPPLRLSRLSASRVSVPDWLVLHPAAPGCQP